jgi:hypothetical protein
MGTWRLRTCAIAGFLAISCGSANGLAISRSTASASRSAPVATAFPLPPTYPAPTTASSARTGQCEAVQPVPQFQPSAPSSRNLALVTLRGSNQLLVRDITDIAHPTTAGTLGPIPAPGGYGPSLEGAVGQFVSATELSYLGGPTDDYYGLPTSLFRMSLSGPSPTNVVKGCQGVVVFAWNPSGVAVVYLASSDTGMTLRQLTAGRDQVLASLPLLPIGGCEVPPCPGPFQNPGDKWDFRLSYSPDGAFISVVQSGISSFLRVWTADGRILSSSDAQGTSMSIWSGGSLYFHDSKGVEVWRNGVISTLLPGIAWIRPKASPGGGQIVYEARDANGSANVFLVDTASGKIRNLGKSRVEPAFITPRYVWYEAEPVCVAAGTCEPTVPGIATGTTYIYDLQDGIETESVITSVADVWPHPA